MQRKRLKNKAAKDRLIRLAKEADLRDAANPDFYVSYRLKYWFNNHFKVGDVPVSFKMLYIVYRATTSRMRLSYSDFITNVRYFHLKHTTPTHIKLRIPDRGTFFKKIIKMLYKEVKRERQKRKEKEKNPQEIGIFKINNE